ncbi:MAG: transcriptional regulator NrdR [Oscillospiraceae bacterium]
MKCAFCGCMESKVVDSRQTEDGLKIRRRRECLSCGARFTTYEIIETIPLMVIKRDKSRQAFDSEKLLGRLMRACGKRPVSIETLEKLVSDIQNTYANQMIKEVNSTELGELVMQRLKEIDQVAYVRFASVYKEFKDIDTFMDELKSLKHKSK